MKISHISLLLVFFYFSFAQIAIAQTTKVKDDQPEKMQIDKSALEPSASEKALINRSNKVSDTDIAAIRKARKKTARYFTLSFDKIEELDTPSCTLVDRKYFCYYTPDEDTDEEAVIRQFISDNEVFLSTNKIKQEFTTDKVGNPIFRLHKTNVSDYILIAPRMGGK